jgi:hypothetical protein
MRTPAPDIRLVHPRRPHDHSGECDEPQERDEAERSMRNAVILVDQIETGVAHGLTRKNAIVEATVRRARPVVLTALAAILAMIPLSRSAFWGPMAITIMGGLFVATFLTLLYLPGLYALWFRKRLDECGTGREQVDAVRQDQSKPAFLLAEAAE